MANKCEITCNECRTSQAECINARHCFMTGEHCSKQTNIQRERERIHANGEINAFVIMNFSNMSDIVYKWRIQPFIESLRKYLFFDNGNKEVVCKSSALKDLNEDNRIRKINVIRSDSNPSSNYVICSRVCQQMQIADLIIVDVSSENTNVFYEFGMAVALGKMILPICYSESYFDMDIPEKAKKFKEMIETHIGCYPWQKKLFEFYGIRYLRSENQKIKYACFKDATNGNYGFEDMQYDCFPYDYEVARDGRRIGEEIYNRLSQSYNQAEYKDNTLVVYTMDGFLNENQAGECIVNYYLGITQQMKKERCFGGDRVGVLVQANSIPENVKDAHVEKHLLYNVGEIIHIGMNQATYIAQKETIKTEDFLKIKHESVWDKEYDAGEFWVDDVVRFVKDYIGNKCILIYPNNPVYVDRIKSGLQQEVLETGCNDMYLAHSFCLYHVMLRTLKYTHEVVVDISGNSLQALFWLGAAHGSDIHAIMVRHELTKDEQMVRGIAGKKERSIFDVSGLWMAELHSYDTEGFYRQLVLAQLGIEQHSKLMLKGINCYEERMLSCLYEERDVRSDARRQEQVKEKIQNVIADKDKQEALVLESYYRDRFWSSMLKYNSLRIYIPHMNDVGHNDNEPRLHTVKWDVDAIAVLSHYLSKRKIIGEYIFKTLQDGKSEENAAENNFICIGAAARPMADGKNGAMSLAQYANSKLKVARMCTTDEKHFRCECQGTTQRWKIFKGFVRNDGETIYTQTPQASCYECGQRFVGSMDSQIIDECSRLENMSCNLIKDKVMPHLQLAQLILWREVREDSIKKVNYWVSLTGASGPATLALSYLLIDEEQKEKMSRNEICSTDKTRMLSTLQEAVREEFLKTYFNELIDRLGKIQPKFRNAQGESLEGKTDEERDMTKKYYERVRYASGLYLSTVLYRYFLPFLSQEDEECIILGMQTYIAYMKSASISPFSLSYLKKEDMRFQTEVQAEYVYKVMEEVVEALKCVLSGFRGVEVLYQVQVESDNGDSDTRKIKGITELKQHKAITCCFVE